MLSVGPKRLGGESASVRHEVMPQCGKFKPGGCRGCRRRRVRYAAFVRTRPGLGLGLSADNLPNSDSSGGNFPASSEPIRPPQSD